MKMSKGAKGRRSRGVIAFVVLMALVLAGCMMLPSVTREDVPDWILEDTAPTEVVTAPARTPRPTRAAPTATGTLAPTPTIPPGLYIINAETPVPCATVVAMTTPVTRYHVDQASCDAFERWEVCTAGYNLRGRYTYSLAADGWSYLASTLFACDPSYLGGYCSGWASNYQVYDSIAGQFCVSSTAAGSYVIPLPTSFAVGSTEFNSYNVVTQSDAASLGDCTGVCSGEWTLELVFEPNPGDAPTPTRDATRDAWITEVLARPEGATCGDWNLRGGCGDNDQFVEVGVPASMSLAGYRIEVWEGTPTP